MKGIVVRFGGQEGDKKDTKSSSKWRRNLNVSLLSRIVAAAHYRTVFPQTITAAGRRNFDRFDNIPFRSNNWRLHTITIDCSLSTCLAAPLARSILSITENHYKVTQWGTPLEIAKHVVFHFGGMPTSSEEPAMHNCFAGGKDVYKNRNIHLVCIDKPGMGGSNFQYFFPYNAPGPKSLRMWRHSSTFPIDTV
jgi:hypothetical protein